MFTRVFILQHLNPPLGTKLGYLPSLFLISTSQFLISTSRFLILAKAFRNDYAAACSTALRSATEKNAIGSYVTVPCSCKMTQRNSTADWFKF